MYYNFLGEHTQWFVPGPTTCASFSPFPLNNTSFECVAPLQNNKKGTEKGIRNKDKGEKHMRQPKWFRQLQEDIKMISKSR
jgi:hypothetical protein